MPTIKQHRTFMRRYLLVTAAVGLPLMAVSGAAVMRGWSGVWDAWTWTGLAVFAVGSVGWICWQHRRHRRMRCPDCGELTARSGRGTADEPVNFVCRRCDVEWVTGLPVSVD